MLTSYGKGNFKEKVFTVMMLKYWGKLFGENVESLTFAGIKNLFV